MTRSHSTGPTPFGHGAGHSLGTLSASATQRTAVLARYQAPSDVERELQKAVETEDYEQAADLLRRLRELQLQDPPTRLRAELEAAISAENYLEAARLRDELALLLPPLSPEQDAASELEAATTSTATTEGVTVTARSFHMHNPTVDSFRFGYRVKITNNSQRTVRLIDRHWIITSDRGQIREVRGPGVVGEQPELSPGESYEYQSACFLPTPRGTMQGHFEMYRLDPKSRKWTTSFLATIAQFGLRATEDEE